MSPTTEPLIEIRCRRVPVAGRPGLYTLEPDIRFTDMPGSEAEAWRRVHQLLCQVLQRVADEMQTRPLGEQRIQVVTGMPDLTVRRGRSVDTIA